MAVELYIICHSVQPHECIYSLGNYCTLWSWDYEMYDIPSICLGATWSIHYVWTKLWAQVCQVDLVAFVWGSGWPSRTWWYTTLCVFAAYWTLQGEHGVGPSLVDQVAGAQVGQVYLGDLCLWLQVGLQPYLYGGAA